MNHIGDINKMVALAACLTLSGCAWRETSTVYRIGSTGAVVEVEQTERRIPIGYRRFPDGSIGPDPHAVDVAAASMERGGTALATYAIDKMAATAQQK